jgi:kumamolisin
MMSRSAQAPLKSVHDHGLHAPAFARNIYPLSAMRPFATLASLATALIVFLPSAQGQDRGTIVRPSSSVERPEDIGVRAHTNLLLNLFTDSSKPPARAETPASLACVYQLVQDLIDGCPIASTSALPNAGVGAIAIVAAYDNPFAAQDLQVYSAQFGLPPANFQQVYADGHQPANDPGDWSLDEALNIEMAHAAAPNAMIILVEAASNSWADLMVAEEVAGQLVAANGGGTVSNSWTGSEWYQERQYDSHFQVPGVIYLASSGDQGLRVGYPAVSPYVIAVGGTKIVRSQGRFVGELYWDNCNGGGGGGISTVYARPSYQDVIQDIVGNHRGVPDMAADANPCTGPAMYDADGGLGWFQIGGTSASAPYLAGVINGAGNLRTSTEAELTQIYRDYADQETYREEFRQVMYRDFGKCLPGWNICTGVGPPITYAGK